MFGWPRKSRSTSGTGGTLALLMILYYKFLKFLQYSRFRGQEIHCWHFYRATMFEWFENPGQLPVQEVLMILSYEFLKVLQYLCFRGQGIHCWHSYWATLFGLPWKSRSTSGAEVLEGTEDCVLSIFDISSIFMFSRSNNPILTFLPEASFEGGWEASVGMSAMDSLTSKT